MRVTISVFGRFQFFSIATALHEHGHLHRLVTSYPGWIARQYGVPRARLRSLLLHELRFRLWQRLQPYLYPTAPPPMWIYERYDRAAARHIPPDSDVLWGLSSFSLHTMTRARQQGIMTVLQRGSTHIAYQQRILSEEYALQGASGLLPRPEIIKRELAEYARADFISLPSAYCARSFVAEGFDPGKLIVQPYGVSLEHFRPAPIQHDRPFRIIYAGSISLRKGIPYLLEAFARLALPDAELWLVGELSPEMAPVLARYGGTFRHIARVPQAELAALYRQCSLFVLPSIEDGFGAVIPQAMACGLPAIVTEHCGGSELIRQGQDGYVIPIRDVASLSERIRYLYEHPHECAAMGRAARAQVERAFSWHDYARQMVAHFAARRL